MYYVARWYDPQSGRFVSPDSIVPQPGDPQSLNRFSYAANNPLRYNDPSGHDWNDAGWWFAGFGQQWLYENLWLLGTGRQQYALKLDEPAAMKAGLEAGTRAAQITGVLEMLVGGTAGGVGLVGSPIGAGVLVLEGGAAVAAHGAVTAGLASADELTLTLRRLMSTGAAAGESAGDPMRLPRDPEELLKSGWQDVTDPRQAQNTVSREYLNPETGARVRFDPGKPGKPGWEGLDHYHVYNPTSTGSGDLYLDAYGRPVPRGSNASHVLPFEE